MFIKVWRQAHTAMLSAFAAVLIGNFFNWWNVTGFDLYIPIIILAAMLIADAGYFMGYMIAMIYVATTIDDTSDGDKSLDDKEDDHA